MFIQGILKMLFFKNIRNTLLLVFMFISAASRADFKCRDVFRHPSLLHASYIEEITSASQTSRPHELAGSPSNLAVFATVVNAKDFVDSLEDDVFDMMREHPPEQRDLFRSTIAGERGVSEKLIKDIELYFAIYLFDDVSFAGEKEVLWPRVIEYIRARRISNPKKDSAESRYFYYLNQITHKSVPQIARELGMNDFQVRKELSDLKVSIDEVFGRVYRRLEDGSIQLLSKELSSIGDLTLPLMEKLAVEFEIGFEALDFYLHYTGKHSRARKWSDQETQKLYELSNQFKGVAQSYAEITKAFNLFFNHGPNDKDRRTMAAIAAKLSKEGLVDKNSAKLLSNHSIAGYGAVKKNGKLVVEKASEYITDHWTDSLKELADNLQVKATSLRGFIKRHSLFTSELSGVTSNLLSSNEVDAVKKTYKAKRHILSGFSLDQLTELIDSFVDEELGRDRNKLSMSRDQLNKLVKIDKFENSYSLSQISRNYSSVLYKKDHPNSNLSLGEILQEEGYSLSSVIEKYRESKGDTLYRINTLEDVVKLIDHFVDEEFDGDRSKLSTSPNQRDTTVKLDGYANTYSIRQVLRLYAVLLYKKDNPKSNLTQSETIQQKGYSRSSVIDKYRKSKGVMLFKIDKLKDAVKLIDHFVDEKFQGDRGKLTTTQTQLAETVKLEGSVNSYSLRQIWRTYGSLLYKIDYPDSRLPRSKVAKEEGYSIASLIKKYQEAHNQEDQVSNH